ncbi:amidohydrolase [Pseudonocardia yunnanensis]|uniref:Amidohydrolase n=1 Tax=Pseudonocardia yunnanensis TaxID=58107 RepID=A0ABW4F341_9PSEU
MSAASAESVHPRIHLARRVITPAGPRRAVAVIGGLVAATGEPDELRARFPGAGETDHGDAVIAPGFRDAHMHPCLAAMSALEIDVETLQSKDELLSALRETARSTPLGGWVRACRYNDARIGGGRLTRQELDAVTGGVPTLVGHIAYHWGVANSAALEAAGFSEDSQPPHGGEFGRDADGRLDGTVYERAFSAFLTGDNERAAIIPPHALEDQLRSLCELQQRFHAAGITAVCDAYASPEAIELLTAARARDALSMRVSFLVPFDRYSGLRFSGVHSGLGDDRLRFVGVKAFLDGAVAGRTCLLDEPHAETGEHGLQSLTDAELAEIVHTVHSAGDPLCVHANGDRAIRLLLDHVEAAQREHPRPDLRHRVEHCAFVDEEILERLSAARMIAVPVSGYVAFHGGRFIDWYGDRVHRMIAYRSLLDHGVSVAGSSDYPTCPFEPLLGMQSMVTRTGLDGVEVGVSQRISNDAALAAYTTGSALATGEHGRVGELAPGQLADMVVLDDDPLEVAGGEIAAIQVLGTYIGGKQVWPNNQPAD